MAVRVRATTAADVPIFFEHQLDGMSRRMAAFTSTEGSDRGAFDDQWQHLLADDRVVARTIIVGGGAVAGYVASFLRFGRREVCYWLGPSFWGRGIATAALGQLVAELDTRPLYARVAVDNLGSIRVLDKSGFVRVGTDRFYANARAEEVDEIIFARG